MTHSLHQTCHYVQWNIIQTIIDNAFTIISQNQFARQYLSTYVLKRQENIFTDAALQTQFVPNQNINRQDFEALPLKDDSLMPVTELQYNSNASRQKKMSSSKLSGSHSKKGSIDIKIRMTSEKPAPPPYKSITEQLHHSIITKNDNQFQQGDNEYISKLRKFKEQEERNRLAKPLTEIRKIKPKPSKGQRIVFDYQGQFHKGIDPKNTQFQQNVMSSSVEKDGEAKNRKQQNRQIEPTTILAKLHDKSIKNRSEIRKQFDVSGEQKRQLILNSLKLADLKTKIVFDGYQVTKKQEILEESLKTEPAVILKKQSSAKAPLFSYDLESKKQENMRINSQLVQMDASATLKVKDSRSRVITEISHSSKKQKITFESQSLKKMLLTQTEEQEHFQLPKSRVQRAITNITAVSSCQDPDLIKIKERLNIKQSNDKLPKILSRYSNLEKEILREIRMKSKA